MPELRPAEGAARDRDTDTKSHNKGANDWEDPYQAAIETKMTQIRMQASPMLEADSDGGSVVELNKLSQLL